MHAVAGGTYNFAVDQFDLTGWVAGISDGCRKKLAGKNSALHAGGCIGNINRMRSNGVVLGITRTVAVHTELILIIGIAKIR